MHPERKLALALKTRAENERVLQNTRRAGHGSENLEEDLESCRSEPWTQCRIDTPTDDEETAERIGHWARRQPIAQIRTDATDDATIADPVPYTATRHIPRSYDKIRPRCDRTHHHGEERSIVLTIGIHDGERIAKRSIEAIDNGRAQTRLANTADDAHGRMHLRQHLSHAPGAIRRIVIDHDDFVRVILEHCVEHVEKRRQILRLVVRW